MWRPPTVVDNSYVVTVYDAGFQPIPWMQNAIIYQIFPDRFYNGDPSNDPQTTDPRYGYPPTATDQILNKKWTDLPEGYCRGYVSPATPCTESPMGRDYFGGDLHGLRLKLGYLKALGINVIYLNPIFESASNHGYDTRDYRNISQYFGNNAEFLSLVTDANALGMHIILDGVFNHVSSDSPYFDRYHHFPEVGACEDVNSPYRTWFIFHEVGAGNGTCAGAGGPNSASYDSWAGFDSLPVLNKSNQDVKNLIYASNDAIARTWLEMGSDGWRLDVMNDPSFPADYWPAFRAAVKATMPDAPVIGELWKKGDVLPMIHGDTADTTMNYRFRNAILGFFGKVDNKGFNDDGQSNQPPSLFASKLLSVREDYPDATYYTLMNLMDSHDTERILWSLTPGAYNREDREFNAAERGRRQTAAPDGRGRADDHPRRADHLLRRRAGPDGVGRPGRPPALPLELPDLPPVHPEIQLDEPVRITGRIGACSAAGILRCRWRSCPAGLLPQADRLPHADPRLAQWEADLLADG